MEGFGTVHGIQKELFQLLVEKIQTYDCGEEKLVVHVIKTTNGFVKLFQQKHIQELSVQLHGRHVARIQLLLALMGRQQYGIRKADNLNALLHQKVQYVIKINTFIIIKLKSALLLVKTICINFIILYCEMFFQGMKMKLNQFLGRNLALILHLVAVISQFGCGMSMKKKMSSAVLQYCKHTHR